MNLTELNYDDLLFIATNMRDDDKKEIYATRWSNSPIDLARDGMQFSPWSYIVHLERPICAIGAAPMHPGVWAVWMFATDEFPLIGLSLTKWVKRAFMPSLRYFGHRAECRSWSGHHSAHKWLENLGAIRESVLKDYGKNREDFYLYVWRN